MIIYPAIDIKDGACVRLKQGHMDEATLFHKDPPTQANLFAKQGFTHLHLIDLNAAFTKKDEKRNKINNKVLAKTIQAAKHQGLKVQLGGGLRSMNDLAFWDKEGVDAFILGSAALYDPFFVKEALRLYEGRIILGVDEKEGRVAVEGWAQTSSLTPAELVTQAEQMGAQKIIHTSIARDGLLDGVDVKALLALTQNSSLSFIASGGVGSIDDIETLLRLKQKNLIGVVVGRALYEGHIRMGELQKLSARAQCTL